MAQITKGSSSRSVFSCRLQCAANPVGCRAGAEDPLRGIHPGRARRHRGRCRVRAGGYPGTHRRSDQVLRFRPVAALHRRGAGEARRTRPFRCADITQLPIEDIPPCQVAMAIGLLHHLDDDAARRLIANLHERLAPGGRLITLDCAYWPDQSRAAQFLITRIVARTCAMVRTTASWPRRCSPMSSSSGGTTCWTFRTPTPS